MYSRNLLLEKLQLAVVDAVVVLLSLAMAIWLRHGWGLLSASGPSGAPWAEYLLPGIILAGLCILLLRNEGLYSARTHGIGEALRIVKVATFATSLTLAITFFYRGYSYSRATVLLFYLLCIVLLFTSRRLYDLYRRAVLSHRSAARRVLIVGFGRVGRHLGRALLTNPSYYEPVGFVDDDPEVLGEALGRISVVGTTGELARLVADLDVDEVILAIPSASRHRLLELVGECLRLKVRWKAVPDLCDLTIERLRVDEVAGLPLVGLRGSSIMGFNWALKRAFDLALAGCLLVVLSPLFACIALAIKLTSRGPALFRQTRIGLQGRRFTLLKFRSMLQSDDSSLHREYSKDWIYGKSGEVGPRSLGAAAGSRPGAVHKMTRDPRVTAVGKFLRKTSLDELPQFWNVLRGDMSVVGPRPPIPYEVERYTEWHKRRLEVLPGITGLWQVSGRNTLSFEEMVRLDIEYIENWSIEADIRIVLRTLPALLFGKAF